MTTKKNEKRIQWKHKFIDELVLIWIGLFTESIHLNRNMNNAIYVICSPILFLTLRDVHALINTVLYWPCMLIYCWGNADPKNQNGFGDTMNTKIMLYVEVETLLSFVCKPDFIYYCLWIWGETYSSAYENCVIKVQYKIHRRQT